VATERLVVTTDDVELVGELTTPESAGSYPAALILSGSGPLDRDSNMPEQKLDIANALSSALAARGVASLRYDKRGVGESGGDYLVTGFDQETRDAEAALSALRGARPIDEERLIVIGHSAGATIAIRLASRDASLAGVVLLSAAAHPGAEVMRWQSDRIAASMRGLARFRRRRFLESQARIRSLLLASDGDTVSVEGSELPARWFREFMAYDPAPDLPAVRCPILAVTGRSDVQVDPEDVERMRALVRAPFDGETPAELTHILRRHTGRPGLDSYPEQLSQPVDAGLLETVASWTSAR
jgi:pimeloyl-ACP methyl ester carboxylesterase